MSNNVPIFMVGCPRSGTTLLRLILDSHRNISCGPETHFLTDLESITGRYWHRLEHFKFGQEYWHAKVAGFFDSFQREYAEARGKGRWADKTPKYSVRLPFINAVFPHAQFLHLIRDPHDVIASHRERWGYRSAVTCASTTWREYVSAAREFGRSLPPERYFELRYERLVSEPESTMRAVVGFLGEPWDPAILEYNKFEHGMGEKHQKLTEKRREAAGDSSTIYRSRVGAGRHELDPLLKLLLRRRSAGLMKELGY